MATKAEKDFPSSYPNDVVKLITTMAINPNNVVVAGSSSIRAIAYPADYDCIDATKKMSVVDAKRIIADLLTTKDCFIGDIKCGEIADWRVIPNNATVKNGKVVNYNANDSRNKLQYLKGAIISNAEYDYAMSLIKDKPTPFEFLKAKKEIKFHIVRWKPINILSGYTMLKNLKPYYLKEGLADMEGLTKIDAVGFVSNNRFTDFSMIYTREMKLPDVRNGLKCDILYFHEEGKCFKALKRIFALARITNNNKVADAILPVLNGDLGILYSLKSDIDTILYLIDNVKLIPYEKIRYEIDQFNLRISHLYQLPKVNNIVNTLHGMIDRIESTPSRSMRPALLRLLDEVEKIINNEALKEMSAIGLNPIPKEFLP